MQDRPGEPIEGPDQHDIETAAAGVGHHLIQAGAARLGARDLVSVLTGDLEAALGG